MTDVFNHLDVEEQEGASMRGCNGPADYEYDAISASTLRGAISYVRHTET